MSINQVAISGNLTRDAELRQTQDGTAALSFSVAVNKKKLNKQTNEWESVPNYVGCVLFGNYATAMQPHLLKGTKVAVCGKLSYSSWEKDGQKRSKLEVIASEVVTLSGNVQGQQTRPKVQYSKPQIITPPPVEVYDEDIPF